MILKFDEYLLPLIDEWIKTSTIRKNTDFKKGDRFTIPGLDGTFVITAVNRIRFDEIDKSVAKAEGYLHENLLKRELKRYYPNTTSSDLLYQIKF